MPTEPKPCSLCEGRSEALLDAIQDQARAIQALAQRNAQIVAEVRERAEARFDIHDLSGYSELKILADDIDAGRV